MSTISTLTLANEDKWKRYWEREENTNTVGACRFCEGDVASSAARNLRRHERTHIERICCEICQLYWKTEEGATSHWRREHGSRETHRPTRRYGPPLPIQGRPLRQSAKLLEPANCEPDRRVPTTAPVVRLRRLAPAPSQEPITLPEPDTCIPEDDLTSLLADMDDTILPSIPDSWIDDLCEDNLAELPGQLDQPPLALSGAPEIITTSGPYYLETEPDHILYNAIIKVPRY